MKTFRSLVLSISLAIVALGITAWSGSARASVIYGLGNTDLFSTARNASNLYSINSATGSATLIGATGANLRGLAINPITGRAYASGATFGSGSGGLWEVDLATGLATFVGGTRNLSDMVFDASGTLFGIESRQTGGINRIFYSVDIGSGLETELGTNGLGTGGDLGGLAYSIPDATFFWSPRQSLRTVDPLTGVDSFIANIPLIAGTYVPFLTSSDTGELFGVNRTSTNSLFSIDRTTGAASLIGSTGVGINSIAYAVTGSVPVPEPAMLGMVAIGLAGLGFLCRRRREAAA